MGRNRSSNYPTLPLTSTQAPDAPNSLRKRAIFSEVRSATSLSPRAHPRDPCPCPALTKTRLTENFGGESNSSAVAWKLTNSTVGRPDPPMCCNFKLHLVSVPRGVEPSRSGHV
eukprot:6612153-Pyramimonas_sp.AAC.1